MANDKGDRKELSKTLMAIIIVVIASLLGISIIELPDETTPSTGQVSSPNVNGQLVVHMIDVGQADCFLLVQDNTTALIDCGTRSTGKDAVEYLKGLGITKLDYVIGTHPHDDHEGGMYDILVNFDIGTVILPDVKLGTITTNWYLKLMNELKTGNYNVVHPKQGDTFALNNATMKVIAAETDVSNVNNYSIVLMVSFGQMDLIMTGDAETEIEKIILESGTNIDAEVLKVGHHGSDTSTSKDFLDAVSPEYALISCKVGNKYEHPIKTTMEKLQERNIEVYRTDECGSVIMTITSHNVTFNCEPGDYLSGAELEERESK